MVLSVRTGGAGYQFEPLEQERRAIEEDIQIPVGGCLHAGHSGNGANGSGDVLRDLTWGLAEPARQLESNRAAQVAQHTVGGIFDRDRYTSRVVERIELGEGGAYADPDSVV